MKNDLTNSRVASSLRKQLGSSRVRTGREPALVPPSHGRALRLTSAALAVGTKCQACGDTSHFEFCAECIADAFIPNCKPAILRRTARFWLKFNARRAMTVTPSMKYEDAVTTLCLVRAGLHRLLSPNDADAMFFALLASANNLHNSSVLEVLRRRAGEFCRVEGYSDRHHYVAGNFLLQAIPLLQLGRRVRLLFAILKSGGRIQ